MAFDAWREDFIARAGAGSPILRRELQGLTLDPKVIEADRSQPEFSRPIGTYVQGAVSEDRIATGRRKIAEIAQLQTIQQQYGVPAEVIVAVWAMESAFGRIQGDNDTVRSLATLAANGRRRAWAETQLLAAMRMISEGHATRGQMKGSWAGAMGQTQFIPETYLARAVDGDGDGRRDIWGSAPDALASTANLLARAGWRAGQSWQVEVTLPSGFDYSLLEERRAAPSFWEGAGVRRADGRPFSAADQASEAQLILPAGAGGPAFLIFPNHHAIRAYNNSVAYALGVGLLAERIRGEGQLVKAWPQEPALSRDQRMDAQRALNALGFPVGEIDGVIGSGTRAALRQWQRSVGLIADGYLTAELVVRLKAQAGL